MLNASSSQFDPIETWAAQDFRSAKALFVPSLKRDIVSSVACTRPPAGGSHGNPHPTARIHIHTGRRSSCVAARSTLAASGGAGDRVSQQRVLRRLCVFCNRVPQWSEGSWIYRGPQRRSRISLGRGSTRSTGGLGGRSG